MRNKIWTGILITILYGEEVNIMKVKTLKKYIKLCEALQIKPSFEGLNKTYKILR